MRPKSTISDRPNRFPATMALLVASLLSASTYARSADGAGLPMVARNTAADAPSSPLTNTILPHARLESLEPNAARVYPDGLPELSPRANPPSVLESDAAYTVAFGDQFYGAVTAGAGEYFAVWVDLRVGGLGGGGYDLYAQRIRPDGSVAAPGSIELLRDPERDTSGIPAVGWNGSVYLVVWHEYGGPGRLLFGMRVTPDGQVLDPGGFLIGTLAGFGGWDWPAVASDGTDFMVVQANAGSIQAFRIGGDGTVLDAAPLVLSSGASGLGFPKLAYGAGVYLVAWAQAPAQAIRAGRVTPAGQVLDPGGINVSGGGTDVDAFVDFDGENFFIVWSRQDGFGTDLWGAHVSQNGAVVSAPALVLDGNPWNVAFAGPMAYNGNDHLIALTAGEPVYSTTDLYAVRVSRQRAPIGAPRAVDTVPGEGSPAYGVSSLASQFLVAWEKAWVHGIYYTYDTEGARIDAAGNVLDTPPIAVSTCAAWQIASAVSFDGLNFLGVFEDWREGKPDYQPDLYAVRVAPTGQRLDATGIRVASGVSGMPEDEPDAVFGGGQHAIVYEKQVGPVQQVRMSRVLPDGTLRDPDGIVIFANEPTGDTFRPKVAWNGQKYCVVWLDNYLFGGQQPLQFALVRVDGTIEFGPANVPSSSDASVNAFEIGSDGNEFLVAWINADRVKATRIGSNGGVLGTQTVQVTGNWITEWPRVAFNGDSYLVAWSQWGEDGVQVYARRVSRSGAPAGNLITVVGPYDRAVPMEVLTLGTDFIVIGYYRLGSPFEMFSARFDASGSPVGTLQVLETLPWDETYAGSSLAITPGGKLLAVHSLWAGMPYNAPRAQAHLFALGAALPGDLDDDGDVDLGDLMIFTDCLSGSDIGNPGCDPSAFTDADLTGDGDVDLEDFSEWQRLF